MNLLEWTAKDLVLRKAEIPVPKGAHCKTVEEAGAAFGAIGPCVVKAQVPLANEEKQAAFASPIQRKGCRSGERHSPASDTRSCRNSVLLEEKAEIAREFYAAVLSTGGARANGHVLCRRRDGYRGNRREKSSAIKTCIVDPLAGFDENAAAAFLRQSENEELAKKIAPILSRLYEAFSANDAELVEINPLALLADGRIVALDCKFTLDSSSAFGSRSFRWPQSRKAYRSRTERRGCGAEIYRTRRGVAMLANGAGLTMTTMDAVRHYRRQPANFLEIGGEAYTKAEDGAQPVLSNPRVKSLVVNFCGAFARTDVMAAGVIKAWENLKPKSRFFSIHGTGEDEAIRSCGSVSASNPST